MIRDEKRIQTELSRKYDCYKVGRVKLLQN